MGKRCSKCKEVKDRSEFGKHRCKKDGLRSQCKECDNAPRVEYVHVEKKRCSKCKEVKDRSRFCKNRSKKDGLQYHCKECRNAPPPEYVHVEEKRCRKCKEVKDRIEFYKDRCKKDGLRSQCKECTNKGVAEWARGNPEKKKASEHRRRAAKRNAPGDHTGDEWISKLEYYGYRCRYCGVHKEDTQEGWLEEEHAIPLSRGGGNWISNIVPACKSCNCRKGTKTFKEFMELLATSEV